MTWYLDGKNLSTLAWNVKERSAGWTVPAKGGENIKVPGRHGSFWTKNKTYEEGHLTLSMWAQGCNPDGTLPLTEDGKRKVRDNLDALTGMFSTSRRLLPLRKLTGSDMALINEIDNPTLTTRENSGMTIAQNSVVNADRESSYTYTADVSRDVLKNPFMVGTSSTELSLTEDIFPDSLMREHISDPEIVLLSGYYHPVKQNVPSVNSFATTFNGFTHRTGVNGTGVIDLNWSPSWDGGAYVAEYSVKARNRRSDKSVMFIKIRLSSVTKQTEVPMNILPFISADGETWIRGTAVDFTATKSFQWVSVQADKLPDLDTSVKAGYYVKYLLGIKAPTVAGGNYWTKGPIFDVDRLAIQDAPKLGNPWHASLPPEEIIIGADTPYIWHSGMHDRSWSVFKRAIDNSWRPVNTADKATTAPYSFAWANKGRYSWKPEDEKNSTESWLALTSSGGQTTFRKSLAVPTMSFSDARILGRVIPMTSSPVTYRVMEQAEGDIGTDYSKLVGSVTSDKGKFVSSKFTIVEGKKYNLEIDVPASDAGYEPAIFIKELHVSNGTANTRLWTGYTDTKWGNAYRALSNGNAYESSVYGMTYKSPGMAVGVPALNAKKFSEARVNWNSEPRGVFSEDGIVRSVRGDITDPKNNSTFTAYGTVHFESPQHLKDIVTLPSSAGITVTTNLYDSSGTRTRSVSNTIEGVNAKDTKFSFTFPLNINETSVEVELKYQDPSYPLASFVVTRLQGYVNKPADVDEFTGNSVSSTSTWSKASRWTATPYFSQSVLTSDLPTGWVPGGFYGLGEDNKSIRFTGGTIRVPSKLSAGKAFVGIRRGENTGNLTVSVTPEGGTTQSVGTISTTEFVQAEINIPSTGSSYLEFTVSGGSPYKSILDVFAIQNSTLYPLDPDKWMGFTMSTPPVLSLEVHPSSRYPRVATQKRADGTIAFVSGDVPDWDGPVLSGGYLQVPSKGSQYKVSSVSTPVYGGYVSTAVKMQVEADSTSLVTIALEGASEEGRAASTWRVLKSQQASIADFSEYKMVDTAIPSDVRHVRLTFTVNNTTLTRSGTAAIIDGVTLVPTMIPIGSNFPGHFVGARGSGGGAYQGDIRQAWVEVTEAIDMSSLAYGTIAEFAVSMNVPEAFWEDVYDTETSVESPGGTSGTFYLTDFGGATAPMSDIILDIEPLTGTLTKFSITDAGSGHSFEYNSSTGRSRVTINTATASVYDQDGKSVVSDVTRVGDTSIFSLTPYWRNSSENLANHIDGTPVITWSANVPIRLSVTGRRKFLIG